MEKDGRIWYYIYDGHGSTRLLTDGGGRVTDRYSYDACGNLLQKEGGTQNDFLYTGEQYNANTGLYYLRARYMDPSTGTFISMDSYPGNLNDPVSLHKYLYANANPVMNTDPSGYMSLFDTGVAMQGKSCMEAAQAAYNAVAFCIGMKLLAQCRAISTVQSTEHLASEVVFDVGVEGAMNGTSSVWKISSQLLADAVEVVTLAYLISGDCIALDVVASTVEVTKEDVEANATKITEENHKQFKGHCVYVLRDSEKGNKVSYVGRSKDPWTRWLRHQKTKKTNGVPWNMYIVKDQLSLQEARALENALICVYTIDALANARHEIAVKNFAGFEDEFARAASLCKIPLDGLYDVMKGDYK